MRPLVNKIKRYIFFNKQKCIIGVILFIYSLFITWFSFNDISIWWDESVYIGMGKYIATGGRFGMWEMFRPPLLPLIYSFLFKLNIPLILAGKIIVIISSIGSAYLVYSISESIKKGSGIFSSIFLMVTPIFFMYSRVPMTDIISVFFVLLVVQLFIKEKYFLTGVFISLAFLFRFPQGLIILPISIAYIINSYNKNFKLWVKDSVVNISKIFMGFLVIVLPYFVSNYILYGDIFKPFIFASRAVSLSSELYNFGLLFYIESLFEIAPFLFLSFLSPLIFFQKKYIIEHKNRKNFILVLIIATIIILYFLSQPHKELRYSLAFVPYLAILSGIFFCYLLKIFKKQKLIIISIILLTLISIFSLTSKYFSYFKDDTGYNYILLNEYVDTLSGSYLSTNPLPSALGNTHVISLFEKASSFTILYNKNIDVLDGIFIKDCDIFCRGKKETKLCYNDLWIINDTINKSDFKKSYEVVIDKCTFSVYKK